MTLAIPLLLILCAWPAFENPWWNNWQAFCFGGTALLGSNLYKKYGFIAALTVIYTLFSGYMVFTNQSRYGEYGPSTALAIDNVSLYGTYVFLLLTAIFGFLKDDALNYMEEIFSVLCLSDSIYVLYQYSVDTSFPYFNVNGGFLGNPSINGTFIALSYPLLAMKPENNTYDLKSISDLFGRHSVRFFWDIFCFLIPILAVFASRSTVPAVTLVVAAFAWFLLEGGQIRKIGSLKTRLIVGTMVSGSLLALFLWKIPAFFQSSGRYPIWKVVFEWWREHSSNLFGMGLGTTFMFGPHIQHETGIGAEDGWWAFFHNDWLQCLFETGIIGLTLYGLLFVKAFTSKKLGVGYLKVALIGYAFASFFNFPSHIALTSVLGYLLIARLLLREE